MSQPTQTDKQQSSTGQSLNFTKSQLETHQAAHLNGLKQWAAMAETFGLTVNVMKRDDKKFSQVTMLITGWVIPLE